MMNIVQRFSNTISTGAIILLAFLLPLFIVSGQAVTTAQSKMLLIASLAAVAALSWVIAALSEGVVRIPKLGILVAAILLPAAYAVSLLTTGGNTSSFVGGGAEQDTFIVACLWAAVLILSAIIVSSKQRAVVLLARFLEVAGFILVLFQIVRLLIPTQTTLSGALPFITSTLAGSWHDLGIVLGLIILFSLGLQKTSVTGTPLWRAFFTITGVGAFLLLVAVNVSDIWLTLSASAALCVLLVLYRSKRQSMGLVQGLRAAILWILLAMLAFGFGWYGTLLHDRLPASLQVVSVEVRPSWQGTFEIGKNSVTGSKVLLFGAGPNSFARNWVLYKPAPVNATQFWNFDFNTGVGVVPTSFVTVGLLGVLAWIIIALMFLFAAWKSMRVSSGSMLVISFIVAVTYLFAFHLMYAPGASISGLLFLLLGVFAALFVDPISGFFVASVDLRTVPRAARSLAMVLIAVCVVLVSGEAIRALASDAILNQSSIVYAQSGDIAATNKLIQRSLSLWPSNDRAHRAAVELGILELTELASKGSSDAQAAQLQATLSATIAHGMTAVSLDSADYQNWFTLALLYQDLAGAGVQGAYEQAKSSYEKARTENPTNPLPSLRLAQLEAVQGHTDEALAELDMALKLKPDLAAAHYLRSQVLAQKQNLPEAVRSATAAVQLVQDDPLGWYNLGTLLYASASYRDAAIAFNQAVTLKGDYANALFMLGLALNQLKDRQNALVALERVRELNPNDTTVARVIGNITLGKDPLAGLQQKQ